MQVRQWKAWCFVLVLVAVLTPGVALAQEGGSASSDTGQFTVVLSMIWDQLGLGAQGRSETEAPSNGLGNSLIPGRVAAERPSNDLRGNISPSGVATPGGTGNDIGPYISPDG